jgi:hypothetical protein
MATNNIELVNAQTAIVDEIYQSEAVTKVLEAPSELVRYAGGKSFQIANMALTGLGDYSRVNGYPEGGVTLEWKTYEFTNDRGTRFSVDRMDNEESFGIVASRLNGDFTRDYLVPEVDAYRFAKIANKAGKVVAANLDKDSAIDAIDEAMVTLTDNKVPLSRAILFVTPRTALAINKNITRSVGNGEGAINNIVNSYNNVPVIVVPQDRFYTGIELLPGTGEDQFGYEKAADAKEINFILMDKSASVNIGKLSMLKYFSPDVNQKKDAHQWDYRLYHESFVFDNKKAGIYVHTKA